MSPQYHAASAEPDCLNISMIDVDFDVDVVFHHSVLHVEQKVKFWSHLPS